MRKRDRKHRLKAQAFTKTVLARAEDSISLSTLLSPQHLIIENNTPGQYYVHFKTEILINRQFTHNWQVQERGPDLNFKGSLAMMRDVQ